MSARTVLTQQLRTLRGVSRRAYGFGIERMSGPAGDVCASALVFRGRLLVRTVVSQPGPSAPSEPPTTPNQETPPCP